jgi:hypothetical protein
VNEVVGKVVGEGQNEKGRSEVKSLTGRLCCLIPVGRTGFGNVHEPAAVGAPLRHVAGVDGDANTPTPTASPDYATVLATCARESTGGDDVVNALARVALEWLAAPDAKRLRFELLGIIAGLD